MHDGSQLTAPKSDASDCGSLRPLLVHSDPVWPGPGSIQATVLLYLWSRSQSQSQSLSSDSVSKPSAYMCHSALHCAARLRLSLSYSSHFLAQAEGEDGEREGTFEFGQQLH